MRFQLSAVTTDCPSSEIQAAMGITALLNSVRHAACDPVELLHEKTTRSGLVPLVAGLMRAKCISDSEKRTNSRGGNGTEVPALGMSSARRAHGTSRTRHDNMVAPERAG